MFTGIQSLAVFVVMCALSFPTASHAVSQDFEDGLLTGWVVGGRQLGSNSWGVSEYLGSQRAYLRHGSFTELELSKEFDVAAGDVLSFDAEFSINGDKSPSASGSSTFYSMVFYGFDLYDSSGMFLDSLYFAAATSHLPYENPTTGRFFREFQPNGLQDYEHSLTSIATELGIEIETVAQVSLTFGGYSSWWSSDETRVWFDNVGVVPEPTTSALLLAGMITISLFVARSPSVREKPSVSR